MSRNFYLLHMRVNGIKSISREIELDFNNKVITTFNPELYKVKAIYGENGSGKTAIVSALNIVKKIILSPNYLIQTADIYYAADSVTCIRSEYLNRSRCLMYRFIIYYLPFFKECRKKYPRYENLFYAAKAQIEPLIYSIEAFYNEICRLTQILDDHGIDHTNHGEKPEQFEQ